jgi:peptidoglycan/xylan/chitin deacetylase (PgdA/CDA1 family)
MHDGPGAIVMRAVRRAARAAKGRLLLGGAIMNGPPRPMVALTFDDGPSRAHTPAILDILRGRGARATFFLLGIHVEKEPEIARRVAAEHEVGCHSYAHAREIVRSLDAFRDDVAKCKEVLQRELGVAPRHYRFPWGDPGRIAPRDVQALFGMTCVHWSGGGHEERCDAEAIARNIDRAIEPGAILLLHDGLAPGSVYPRPRDATVAALPRVLDMIAARGLTAVTLAELLAP